MLKNVKLNCQNVKIFNIPTGGFIFNSNTPHSLLKPSKKQKKKSYGHDEMISRLTSMRLVRCVLFTLKIFMRALFSQWNVHTRVNLRFYKIREFPGFLDFHSLYQLLHSQVYRNGLELWICNVEICIYKSRLMIK